MRLLLAIFFCLLSASLDAADQNVAGADPLGDAARELQAGRSDAALAIIDAAEKTEPTAPGLALRGAIYLEQGKLDEAVHALEAAREKAPQLFLPGLNLGAALFRQNKWAEARAVYEEMLKKTNILILSERLRYVILLTYLGAKDEAGAKTAMAAIVFPTETPAYYYAQAAWASAHDDQKAAAKWLKTAEKIFDEKQTAWYARPLYDLGWIKKKPPLSLD